MATTQKVEQAKALVAGMSPRELAELLEYSESRKQLTKPARSRSVDLFYNAMSVALKELGNVLPPVDVYINKTKHGKELLTAAPKVDAFIDRVLHPIVVSSADRGRAHNVIARLLIDSVLHYGAPLGPKTVVEAIERLPSAFDDSFPGYIESGLASRILQKIS